ncbi:Cell growth-regulating nucleolar protein [Triplophysa tibetana]|uniref:Cell growth-regulating nucleolar protein n=1 Tax=Triplophysa tibetana TaxID=1572043 RepID=A0A5A9NIL0_9TELE|nr:Cell growth-regulating nucleolar protein [Triplophysa tibetana]
MVFFTCNACGESLKKAQVDKHVLKCRGCQVLSCIDCGKDFWGEDYRNHIKCISEDQKYGGKDFQAKANKGDVKQQQWIVRIQEAMKQPDIDPKLHHVLDQVSSYENVPRKRAKFQNWMKNCLKIYSPPLIEQVWEIFSTTATSENNTQNKQTPSECSAANQTNPKVRSDVSSKQNGHDTRDEKQMRKKRKRQTEENQQNTEEKIKKKHKKRNQEEFEESLNTEGEESVEQEVESEPNAKGKFNWKGTIKAVLKDAPDEGLAVKKIRKKVLAQYYSFTGSSNYRSEEEVLALFNKKINHNPKFKVLKDKVRLVK